MQIIKEKKGNYEIYDLIENTDKAKQFREENAESIEFYRIINDNWNFKGLFSQIATDHKEELKKIYELRKLPNNENPISYENAFLHNKGEQYVLSKYHCNLSEFNASLKTKIQNQQIDFKEEFIKEGLSKYTFKENKNNGYNDELYIFLNSYNNYLDEKYFLKYYGSENVIHLPYEIAAQYLLERPHLEAGFYFNRIENPEIQEQLLNTFDIDLSSTLTEKQYEDLVKLKIINEEQFTRNLKLNAPIAKLINKKR